MDTVCNLARGYHSFGTGYGKSIIGELYFHMFTPQRKPVVLVLNPLGSLGEDQLSFAQFLFKIWKVMTEEICIINDVNTG